MGTLLLRNATLICVAFFFALVLSPCACAQTTETKGAPTESAASPTEEVPYVQTPMHVVHRMLQLSEVSKSDVLWDLGSGDGRIVITAAKRGARATGFEIDPRLIEESKVNAKRAGVASRARFVERDIFTLDFSTPSVVTLYLLPEFNLKLRPLLLSQLKPGARVVSHEWDMGDWLADETLLYPSPAKLHGTKKEHKVFLWVVPAQIAGRWRFEFGNGKMRNAMSFDLVIEQTFQRVTITANRGEVRWAELRGNDLAFEWSEGTTREVFRGRVIGAQRIVSEQWRATRKAP